MVRIPRYKPYIARVVVYYEEGDPYKISDVGYSISARDEEHAMKILRRELRRFPKYTIESLKEINLENVEAEYFYWKGLEKEIIKNAVKNEVEKCTKEILEAKGSNFKQSWIPVNELTKNPEEFYSFIKENLTPNSKVFFYDGRLFIHTELGRDKPLTFYEIDEEKYKYQILEEVLSKIDEFVEVLEKQKSKLTEDIKYKSKHY